MMLFEMMIINILNVIPFIIFHTCNKNGKIINAGIVFGLTILMLIITIPTTLDMAKTIFEVIFGREDNAVLIENSMNSNNNIKDILEAPYIESYNPTGIYCFFFIFIVAMDAAWTMLSICLISDLKDRYIKWKKRKLWREKY